MSGKFIRIRNVARQKVIALLLEQPAYLEMRSRERLELVRKGEETGLLSAVCFHLAAIVWVKTGKILKKR